MKKCILLFLFCGFFLHGSGISFDSKGRLVCDGFASGLLIRDHKWNCFTQHQQGKDLKSVKQGNSTVYTCKLQEFEMTQRVTPLAENRWKLRVDLKAAAPVKCNGIYWQVNPFVGLAENSWVQLNRSMIRFPEKLTPGFDRQHYGVRKMVLPLHSGFLQFDFPQPIQVKTEDLRRWKIQSFDIRLHTTPHKGELTAAAFEAEVSFVPYQVQALSLKAGSSASKVKKYHYIPFFTDTLLKLQKGKSSSDITLPGDSCKLYLLSSSSVPAGRVAGLVEFTLANGKKQTQKVIAGEGVQASDLLPEEKGSVFISEYAVPAAAGSVRLIGMDGVFAIGGLAATAQNIPFRKENSDYTLKLGEDWRRIEHKQDIVSGSALDFSSIALDAPAGKYGRLVVKGEHFEFAGRPGKPVRFYGTNLCFSSCFPTRAQADIMADRLAKQGFNAVRLHHFDQLLFPKGAKNTVEPDESQLRKMDYLVAALKKKGIYVTLDLYTIRIPLAGELAAYPEGMKKYGIQEYKLAVLLFREVREHFKRFIRNFLTRKNTVTGMTYAADPVFTHISVLNENNPNRHYGRASSIFKAQLEKSLREYCRRNGITLNDENRAAVTFDMLNDCYREYWQDINRFLRQLGVKAPLAEQNFMREPKLIETRVLYEYVDNHLYWDHPNFGGKDWNLPLYFTNECAVSYRLSIPKGLANSRLFGRPYTVTEYNSCYPNSFRAEAGIIYSAMAAYQDWAAIYSFDYADSLGRMFGKGTKRLRIFDICNDPPRLFSNYIGAALYLRGDVRPASDVYPVAVSAKSGAFDMIKYPEEAEDLALIGKTGSLPVKDGKLAEPLPPRSKKIANLCGVLQNPPLASFVPTEQAPKKLYVSDTGELRADFRDNSYLVVTPGTEAAVFQEGRSIAGKNLKAVSRKHPGVIGAITLNGNSFADTSRVLFLHLTDCKQENSVYDSKKLSVLKNYGNLEQQIIARGICDVELTLSPGNWKVYALDFDGTRLGTVAAKNSGGKIRFTADTFYGKDKSVFAYEIIK